MTGRLTVHSLNVMQDANWSFHDGQPHYRPHRGGSASTFDPFPAYPHNLELVTKAAQFVERVCPPIWNVELWVADREETSRSNGHSNLYQDGHHDENNKWVKDDPIGHILLSGKRIPPHPGMTHHLVAHEYGHNVEWMLNRIRFPEGDPSWGDSLLREYCEVRALPVDQHIHHGEGGNWHSSIHEVFACDFRILVCKTEPDFWPHPGIAYPDSVELDKWWAGALASLAEWNAALEMSSEDAA